MTRSGNLTLCIRPSLSFPKRWSVDYWLEGRREAAYQASFVTFACPEEAREAAAQIKAAVGSGGDTVQIIEENENISRGTIAGSLESEEEIKKHLEKYLEKAFEPMRKFSLTNLFEIKNWKAVATRSPHLLSLLILAALFFHGRLEKLLVSLIPGDLGLKASEVLLAAPIIILAATLLVDFERTRGSYQLDLVREWILKLTVFFSWDRGRFLALSRKELAQLEYASTVKMLESAGRRDPSSATNLLKHLHLKEDKQELLASRLLQGDFARKIQALAGMAAEKDY